MLGGFMAALSSVVRGSVAMRGAFNTQVTTGEGEPAESALRRFRKAVMETGVIPEVRRRRYFETPIEAKKRKVQEAAKRRKFKGRPKTLSQGLAEASNGAGFGAGRGGMGADGKPRVSQWASKSAVGAAAEASVAAVGDAVAAL